MWCVGVVYVPASVCVCVCGHFGAGVRFGSLTPPICPISSDFFRPPSNPNKLKGFSKVIRGTS